MLEQVWEIVTIGVIVALVLVGAVVGLVRGRTSRLRELRGPVAPGGSTRTLTPPTDLDSDLDDRTDVGDRAGVGTLEGAPTEPALDQDLLVEEPPASTVERPASARGRLARLRARLARSNSAIGNALLVLLSRGGLDEAAWEDVEDTLIGSDLG
nr:signal recognition particle-docking protein FtsY [Actinomycetota bacterium]